MREYSTVKAQPKVNSIQRKGQANAWEPAGDLLPAYTTKGDKIGLGARRRSIAGIDDGAAQAAC